MYLDIFKEKSIEENFKSLRAFVVILSLIIMGTIIISEFTSGSFLGTMKAITMMVGYWLFCSAFQHHLQKVSYPARLLIFLLLGTIQWFGIFIYFTERY
jgi:hypothetical protein